MTEIQEQEQLLKTLEALREKAASNKNTLEYDEILKAFEGTELTEDKIDMILEYFEKKKVDVLQGKAPDDLTDDSDDDLLLVPIDDADGNAYRYSVREEDISESYTVTYSNGSAQSADPSDGYYIVNNRYNYTTYTVWK